MDLAIHNAEQLQSLADSFIKDGMSHEDAYLKAEEIRHEINYFPLVISDKFTDEQMELMEHQEVRNTY